MQIVPHPLSIEFPEFKDAMHALKLSDAHFAKLFTEYDEADKAVNQAENGVTHLTEIALEDLKKIRISLKDQLFQLLQTAAAA